MYSKRDIHSVEICGFMHFKYIHSTYMTKESKTYACNKFMERKRTKNEGVQAFVWHVLINQHHFFLLNATTKNFDKIPMLKFCNQHNFIFEFFYSLP